jgi:hypothetical protein
MNEKANAAVNSTNHLGQPNSHPVQPGSTNGNDAFGNNNKYVSSINGSNASSDSDATDTEVDEDRSTKGSLESTSEQSLTSPAGGYGSLPSLGSPSGSVASPSTPSTVPSTHFTNADAVAVNDWFRHSAAMGGAFKPPFGAQHYLAAQAAQQQAAALAAARGFHPPLPSAAAGSAAAAAAAAVAAARKHLGGGGSNIGNDPRDSKHPLSVMQLTAEAAAAGGNTRPSIEHFSGLWQPARRGGTE